MEGERKKRPIYGGIGITVTNPRIRCLATNQIAHFVRMIRIHLSDAMEEFVMKVLRGSLQAGM
jgi:hypothetical protein